jgi:hypothetical protein
MAQLSHDKASLQSGLSRHCALLGHTSVRFDLSHDTVPPPQPSTTAAAAAQGNIKKVQKFVKKGFSVEKKNEYGESLLHVAALSKVGHTPTPAPEHVQQCFSLHRQQCVLHVATHTHTHTHTHHRHHNHHHRHPPQHAATQFGATAPTTTTLQLQLHCAFLLDDIAVLSEICR